MNRRALWAGLVFVTLAGGGFAVAAHAQDQTPKPQQQGKPAPPTDEGGPATDNDGIVLGKKKELEELDLRYIATTAQAETSRT